MTLPIGNTKRRSFRTHFSVLTLIAVLTSVGCGESSDEPARVQLFPASGNLTMDGKPFGPATLRFVPENSGTEEAPARGFVGVVDADGKVTVTTYEGGDGAPSGTYKVTAFSSAGTAKPIPGIYESETRTPLKVLIADIAGEDANKFTIDLNSKASKPSKNATFQGIDADAAAAGVTQ